ncbi:cytochrome ubiquinol oxidase subunit I [Ammonifex thiophilus]|uniref:Cytochrome ubiquinol oxidase subunit I n=1 Tax=Ammonifex thiophilus TaxID=444093 RepID=A0A3D8P6D5_9THEO|nr:cytochrome ubiquinol oxidase subunit I [Ammonifex thiophilus]RDV84884.1 cytochrome ubiquinol oxidase subunit I [Ammonifex thiophilus]
MDALTLALARWQFAITATYHFFFVPLTLGLSLLVAVMETLYVRTGDENYKRMTKFWGKLFVINFVLGVVTGILQEFHFGMNWSEYSRFVGDIFGAPLAVEALLAFFLESTFLGVWIFGWDKISKRLHLLSIWLVAIASNLSALWILIANSFMQEPVGFVLRSGRAEMKSFWALVTNPNIFTQFPHTVIAGLTTASFFIMGISAYHLLRRTHLEVFRPSMRIGVIAGLLAVLVVALTGHFQGRHLVEAQPMKIAAANALWETSQPAPLNLVAVIDQRSETNRGALALPALESLLAHHSFSAEVKGIKELQQEMVARYGPGYYIPPVAVTFWSFRIMVGAGLWLLFLSFYAYYLYRKGKLEERPGALKALLYSIPVPYLANTAGWAMTEVGRQPWIVYGLQRVDQALSPCVTAGQLLITLLGFTLLLGILAVVDVFLLARFARQGPEAVPASMPEKEVSLWS